MSHWPLEQLLQSEKNGLVVDVGAGIGFVSLKAASLGARVISVEHDKALVGLLRESVKLNNAAIQRGIFGPVRVVLGAASASASFSRDEITVDGIVGMKNVELLHIASRGNGEIAALNGCMQMLKEKRVRYILLELCPQKAKRAGWEPLKTLREIQNYGYNVFDDSTAEDGALTGPELLVLLHELEQAVRIFSLHAPLVMMGVGKSVNNIINVLHREYRSAHRMAQNLFTHQYYFFPKLFLKFRSNLEISFNLFEVAPVPRSNYRRCRRKLLIQSQRKLSNFS